MKYKHLFGPVPSRRLGLSLGIDPVPYKTCSFDCVYCECGATTKLTAARNEYIPVDEIISELDSFLSSNPTLDYITFSGSGEPTLNIVIGRVLSYLKKNFSQYKIAVLTNSSLFSDPEVREELLLADVIMPSLDAVSENVFQKINRPASGINISEIINGLIDFRKEFSGKIWLEIFIITGINDTDEEIEKLHAVLNKINPDLIQLNSLDRPGTENWVVPADEETLEKFKKKFADLPVVTISNYQNREKIGSYNLKIEDAILSTISRRPCTAEDLSEILDIHIAELNKYLDTLHENGRIEAVKKPRGIFFKTTV
ncbi:MAG: radical SAM protein [Candidatus Cloacimonetes bacterium]|nr:radical SAM protein [Candidatus Cloacimonadota bacterium]